MNVEGLWHGPQNHQLKQLCIFFSEILLGKVPLDWHGRQTDHMDLIKKVTTTFHVLCGRKVHIAFTLHEPLEALMLTSLVFQHFSIDMPKSLYFLNIP
jgi:hypothetical protein